MTDTYDAIVRDLITRTETAVRTVASLAADTGITFQLEDAVDAVERDLPADYPTPTTGDTSRRDLITRIAKDIFSGELYGD